MAGAARPVAVTSPLAAVVFQSVGRNPIVGLAAAFAGVSGGYSANILIGTVDPLLSGITTEAARIIDPSFAPGEENEILPTANYFFMFVSTFMITIMFTIVFLLTLIDFAFLIGKIGAWDIDSILLPGLVTVFTICGARDVLFVFIFVFRLLGLAGFDVLLAGLEVLCDGFQVLGSDKVFGILVLLEQPQVRIVVKVMLFQLVGA